MTMRPGDGLAWGELGNALMQRRIELSPRYKNRRVFSEERQIGYRLVYDIEENRRTNFGRATILDIARAYAVSGDSLDRVLGRTGSLQPVAGAASVQQVPLAPAAADTEIGEPSQIPRGVSSAIGDLAADLVPIIETEVRRARMRHPARELTGRDIFADEHEAAIWDIPGLGNRYEVVALLRAVRQRDEGGNAGANFPRRVQ